MLYLFIYLFIHLFVIIYYPLLWKTGTYRDSYALCLCILSNF